VSRQVSLAGEILITTDKAVLFRSDSDDSETWIPRSVLLDGDKIDEGDRDVVCAEWFALKEDLS